MQKYEILEENYRGKFNYRTLAPTRPPPASPASHLSDPTYDMVELEIMAEIEKSMQQQHTLREEGGLLIS